MLRKKQIKSWLNSLGWTAGRYDPKQDISAVERKFYKDNEIDLVFDVGANSGQFGTGIRENGYKGRIVSFEPLTNAYGQLKLKADSDGDWSALNVALGDKSGMEVINVSENSWSSSILKMLPLHESIAPTSKYQSTQQVEVIRLDDVFARYASSSNSVLLKIDTQGYTAKVLTGGAQSLANIEALQIELSLVRLYDEEPLIGDVLTSLYSKGFKLHYAYPELYDEMTGAQLQMNGIFVRCS